MRTPSGPTCETGELVDDEPTEGQRTTPLTIVSANSENEAMVDRTARRDPSNFALILLLRLLYLSRIGAQAGEEWNSFQELYALTESIYAVREWKVHHRRRDSEVKQER
jgi:hypothetical protein